MAAWFVALPARAETEVSLKGEIAFFAGDDDVRRATEATVPSSPPPSFGERAGYAFAVDELSPRGERSARELTLELLVRRPSDFEGVSTAAIVRVGLTPEARTSRFELFDRASALELERRLGARVDLLRVHPLNGDELRVGWLEVLAWGGEASGDSPYARAGGLVPAAIYRHEQVAWGAHLGVKTAFMNVPGENGLEQDEVFYGVFGGGALRPLPALELGIQAGYFQHGALPQPDVRGEPLLTTGASVRAVIRDGLDEPVPAGLFPSPRRARSAKATGFAFAVEGAFIAMHLKQAAFTGLARWVPARAGAAVLELSAGDVGVVGGAVLRDAAFVTRQGPGAILPEAAPVELPSYAEWTGFLNGRFELPGEATAGVDFSLRMPAALVAPAEAPAGTRAVLVHGPGRLTLLPARAERLPIFEVRSSLALRVSTLLTGVLFLQYRRDTNAVLFARSEGEASYSPRTPASPDAFGYGAALRAAF